MKPYELRRAHLHDPERERVVQIISRPIPNKDGLDTIKVRRVPSDPATMIEIEVRDLEDPALPGKWKVHYAVVEPGMIRSQQFPEDMLRYDVAEIVDDSDSKRVLIATVRSTNQGPAFTQERWRSFGWNVKTAGIEEVSSGQTYA